MLCTTSLGGLRLVKAQHRVGLTDIQRRSKGHLTLIVIN